MATLLAALDHRRRTGEGQYIDFSQAESALHFLAPAMLDQELHGRVGERHGNAHLELCPHGVFPCAGEDRWVAVVAQSETAWVSLAGLLDRDDLATMSVAQRLAHRQELEDVLSTWTAQRSAAEAEAACQEVGVAAHQVQNSPELMVDPQLAFLEHWVTVQHALHGPTVVEASRVRLSETPIGPVKAAPMLGEDTFSVLSDVLGYDEDQIAELAAAEIFD